MSTRLKCKAARGPRTPRAALFTVAVALATGLSMASAQTALRTGKEVVDSVCAACHASGQSGAPRIGDSEAWTKRASQGLSGLTRHAVQGIRQMPAHGGSPGLTDLEIGRAITYMVNQSGGHWTEPVSEQDLMAERSGELIVTTQCVKCHGTGEQGAPRIGDRNAWIPRLTAGLDVAVRSAIRGHGGMPARGGLADLTDSEVRRAIVYMYNPSVARPPEAEVAQAGAKQPAANHDPYLRTVSGMDIYLGFVPAERMRAFAKGSEERSMHGGAPRGSDFYHVNVSLFDHLSKAPIKGARVELQVEDPGLTSETKTLEPMTIGTPSYGDYFKMKGNTRYVITVRVRAPGSPATTEARFEYGHP
ncbi:MAG: c-type cytochrome [Burkholderiales bacterium]|nr:c-type cytochrome [Burkholderiales bacterium]